MIYSLKRYKKCAFIMFFCVMFILASFPLSSLCFAYYYRYTKLKTMIKLNKTEYAVLILSNPYGIVERMTIRDTWMKLASNIIKENGKPVFKWRQNSLENHKQSEQNSPRNKNCSERIEHNGIAFLFAIGINNLNLDIIHKLRYEDVQFNDLLLLENMEDKYEKLAVKMLHAMTWLSENMKDLKYMIKCDDDSFVRVDLIVKYLFDNAANMGTQRLRSFKFASLKSKTTHTQAYHGLYWGYFVRSATVSRSGKWAENEWFLCDSYLPYALGGGYVVSRSVVDYVARNKDVLSLYMCEDVTMGVWTAPLEVRRVHDPRFESGQSSGLCDPQSQALVLHKLASADLRDAYSRLLQSKGRLLCANSFV